MPVVLNFDVPVKNKAEFEKNLQVTSSPAQAGSWRWFSDTEVRYRPKNYWKPGTKVTAYANVNGVNAGGGIYGQSSTKTSFTVGRSMKIRINLATRRRPRSTATARWSGRSTSAPASRLADPQRREVDHGQGIQQEDDQRDDRCQGGVQPDRPVRDADHQLR